MVVHSKRDRSSCMEKEEIELSESAYFYHLRTQVQTLLDNLTNTLLKYRIMKKKAQFLPTFSPLLYTVNTVNPTSTSFEAYSPLADGDHGWIVRVTGMNIFMSEPD